MRAALLVLLAALIAGPALAQTPPAPSPPAQTPAQPPAAITGPSAQPGDPFGEELVRPEQQMLALKGTANWDDGFDALKEAFQTVAEALPRLGLKATGAPVAVYLRADDTGFDFEAGYPIEGVPSAPPQGELAVRPVPAGRTLRFTHRGAYDNMDSTYEALTNLLDDRRIEVQDMYMEEYVVDPLTTGDDDLHIVIYVFPKG